MDAGGKKRSAQALFLDECSLKEDRMNDMLG